MTEKKKRRVKPYPYADNGQVHPRFSRVRLWLIDCDDTIYEASAGMLSAIHRRMEAFIAEKLGVSIEEGREIQHAYWKRYGATFVGLQKHHGISPEAFFNATHRFDLSTEIPQDFSREKLRGALKSLKGRRVLVTNGPACYVKALLPLLGASDLFDDVVSASDMRLMGVWRSKPDAALLANLAARFHEKPERCALIEDSPGNLKAAKKLGMLTVWCAGSRKHPPKLPAAHSWADAAVRSLPELARLLARSREAAKLAKGSVLTTWNK